MSKDVRVSLLRNSIVNDLFMPLIFIDLKVLATCSNSNQTNIVLSNINSFVDLDESNTVLWTNVDHILNKWGFSELIKTFKGIMLNLNLIFFNSFVNYLHFKDNEIDLEAFDILDEAVMERLIPKMGTLLKFKKEYQNYLKTKKQQVNQFEKRPYITEESQRPTKKLKKEFNFCLNLNLESLLKQSLKGELVLENSESLNNIHRQYMCQIIVDDFVKNEVKMGIPEFENIKQKIISLFPTDAENADIYFCKPIKDCRKPKGKLPDRYYNFTRLLRKHNVLQKDKEAHESLIIGKRYIFSSFSNFKMYIVFVYFQIIINMIQN
jgi:hypothetical protein